MPGSADGVELFAVFIVDSDKDWGVCNSGGDPSAVVSRIVGFYWREVSLRW